jgi:hypothetical protein
MQDTPSHATKKEFIPMKTIVNKKLLSFVFAISILLLQGTVLVVDGSHPTLGRVLAVLDACTWLTCLVLWAILLIQSILKQSGAWRRTLMHLKMIETKTNDAFASVEQLKHLQKNIQQLGLALHGLTPEMELARHTHFQMLGQPVPDPILPSQNALLSAEFESLVKMLNHFGFPSLESVRLQQKDLVFFQQWGRDLEARLRQQQKRSCEQHAALCAALATVAQQHQTLGETCALAQNHSGYQRIQGALRFLEKLVNDNRCPWDLAQAYVQKLQSDMDTLMKQFEQIIS